MSNTTLEVVTPENVEDIVFATQKALTITMLKILKDLKADIGKNQPGLTWTQIEFFINQAGQKKPRVVIQEEPM